jgi:hypothetical protein
MAAKEPETISRKSYAKKIKFFKQKHRLGKPAST